VPSQMNLLFGMLYQLGLEAERSWQHITGHERIAEVISGVVFVDGLRQDTYTA